jgi:ribosomal-protein-alanine N-acetyltransferase
MEKLGMRREGHLRACERVDDAWRDHYLYAMLAEEWKPAATSAR